MADCNTKKRYRTQKLADAYAADYNKNPFLNDEDMLGSYECKRHKSWHVGHSRNFENLSPLARINKLLDDENHQGV